MKPFKFNKSSSLPHLFSQTKTFSETSSTIWEVKNGSTIDSGMGSTAFSFHPTEKGNKNLEIGQFFFMYKDFCDDEKGVNQYDSKDILQKLSQWDKDHLNLQKNYNSKGTKIFSPIYNDKLNHTSQTEIFEQNLELNCHKVKKHEQLLDQMKKTAPLKYKSRNPFVFDIFYKDSSTNEILSEQLKKEIALEKYQHQKEYYRQFIRDQMKAELRARARLMEIYQKIILLKLKREKYENVLDDTYRLLDAAKTEYFLCTDILKERIKSVSKYYEAFRESNRLALGEEMKKETEDLFVNSLSQNNSTNTINSNTNSVPEIVKEVEGYKFRSNVNSPNQSNQMNGSRYRHRKAVVYNIIPEINKSKKGNGAKGNNQKKTLLDIYEEKMKKYKEYLAIVDDINKEIKNYEAKYNEIKTELEKFIGETLEKINLLSRQGRENKMKFEILSKEQQIYYKEILKQGHDTRNEGLSWVIKRLLELNVPLEHQLFPTFLDTEQIEYLINISKLGFENTQLKLALQTLKARQQKIIDNENQQKMDKITKFSLEKNNKTFSSIIHAEIEKAIFSKENIAKLENIYLKHKNLMKASLESKIEESEILAIVTTIKKRLCSYAYCSKANKKNFWTSNDDGNNIVKFLLEHEKQKEFFEDILVLRSRIKELDSFIKKFMKDQFQSFKSKFETPKYKIKKGNLEATYDIVYSALFGKAIFV